MLWMLLLAATLAPDQWPQFRGPDASGVAEDARLPERWSQAENVAWKTDIPGLGWTSAIGPGEPRSPGSGKSHGLPPVLERPTSWQTFLHAHWARSPYPDAG
jgi:hypothetical protein